MGGAKLSHLLAVQRYQSKAMQRKGTLPLWLECPVPPETAPYLVTSTSSVMWIEEPHPGNLVRAAVRETEVTSFYQEVVEAVRAMGETLSWGNVHPMTLEGIQAAIEHVEFYETGPVELLVPKGFPMGVDSLLGATGLMYKPCSWLPEGTALVVPKDRGYIGWATRLTPRKIAGVVHNAARTIAILR